MNESVTKAIDNYLDLKDTDYAILINGEWGSGKTYFIKKYFKKKEQNISRKMVYVSLFGIDSTKKLINNFITEYVKEAVLNEKHDKYSNIAKSIFQFIPKIAIDKYEKLTGDNSFSNLPNFDVNNLVLVLDDLERCSLETKSVFGIISMFIDKYKLKTIIISHDDLLKDDSKNEDYQKYKEKIIGKTMKIEVDYKSLFNDFLSGLKKIKDNTYNEFLETKNPHILQYTKDIKLKNLRTFKCALVEFERMYLDLREKDEIVNYIENNTENSFNDKVALGALFGLIASMDTVKNYPSEIKNFIRAMNLQTYLLDESEKTLKIKYHHNNEYFINQISFLLEYAKSGKYSIDLLFNDICSNPKINSEIKFDKVPDHIKHLDSLNGFLRLEQKDFNKYFEGLKKGMIENKYLFNKYIGIINLVFSIEQHRIVKLTPELKNLIINAMKNSVENHTYIRRLINSDFKTDGKIENDDYDELIKLFYSLQDSKKPKFDIKKEAPDKVWRYLLYDDDKYQYRFNPIFSEIQPDDFIEFLKARNNIYILYLNDALIERYRSDSKDLKIYNPEIDNLKTIKKLTEKYCEGLSSEETIKKRNLTQLIKILDTTIQKIP